MKPTKDLCSVTVQLLKYAKLAFDHKKNQQKKKTKQII